jgi:hypothetical protein
VSLAILSYAGQLGWGFTAECQVVPDLEKLAEAVAWALVDLEVAAGVAPARQPPVAARWSAPSRQAVPQVALGASEAVQAEASPNGGR